MKGLFNVGVMRGGAIFRVNLHSTDSPLDHMLDIGRITSVKSSSSSEEENSRMECK